VSFPLFWILVLWPLGWLLFLLPLMFDSPRLRTGEKQEDASRMTM
jgi:hypothetical protein